MLVEKIKANLSIIVFAIFLIIGLGLYANSFGNKFFWDDDDLIVNNTYVHDFSVVKFFTENEIAGIGQTSNYWRPLTLISFALDYKLWGGPYPIGFHLTNTLLHILAAWLVFILLLKLLSLRGWPDNGKSLPLDKGLDCFLLFEMPATKNFLLAFLPSLLFLIHPLQTEAVTYTAGRADSLSAVFVLLSIWFYVSFRLNKKWWQYVVALLFFVFGILSKEQGVLLPALILLVEGVFLIKEYNKKKVLSALKFSLGFFVLAAFYLFLRLTVLNFNNILSGPEYDLNVVYNQSLWSRLFTFCLVMLSYFKLLFVPTGLHMAREVAPIISFFSWPVISFVLLLIGLFVLGLKTWKSNRLIAFGWLWFFIILLPRTNILKINRPMYEHWLYLPMVGFWLAFFAVLFLIYEKITKAASRKLVFVISIFFLASFLTFFTSLTVIRNREWRDPITFYENNLRYTPNAYIQHNNLGMAYADANRLDEAISEYRKAIAIKDVYPQIHYNLGNALVITGHVDEGITEYRKAINISPSFFNPYANMVSIYLKKDDKKAVQAVFAEMEKNFTNSVDFWYLKGAVYYQWKDGASALESLKKAAILAPNDKTIQKALQAASQLKQ